LCIPSIWSSRCVSSKVREEILSEIIAEIISRFGELSPEVLVPFLPDQEFEGKNLHIPV
jgi:hypothetical protein